MTEKTIRQALNEALDEEMQADDNVFIIGEEVGEYEGAYKVTRSLLKKYGPKRVIDTPICEESFTGIAIGSAMLGLRPVVEWMTFNFSLMAVDQVINNAAKLKHMSGGQISIPIVFRGPNGPAEALSSQHSQSLESLYSYFPGLTIVSPSNANDAKALLKTSIRTNYPVLFLESEMMYSLKGEVHEENIPIGKAKYLSRGKDITIIGYGQTILPMIEAQQELEGKNNITMELIDLRSIKPFDEQMIFESVKKTNRCLIVAESNIVSSFAAYLAYHIHKHCFDYLDMPVEVLSSEDVPMPYSYPLEKYIKISKDKILSKIKKIFNFN